MQVHFSTFWVCFLNLISCQSTGQPVRPILVVPCNRDKKRYASVYTKIENRSQDFKRKMVVLCMEEKVNSNNDEALYNGVNRFCTVLTSQPIQKRKYLFLIIRSKLKTTGLVELLRHLTSSDIKK